MKRRCIVETVNFAKKIDVLIENRRLLVRDFDVFKLLLSENPEEGDLIIGTGGVRKVRLKSSSKGKSGGFRVCYYFIDQESDEIFLLLIYQKNEQENLSSDEKMILRKLINEIKRV